MLLITALLAFIMFFFLFVVVGRPRKPDNRALSPYLSGITADADSRAFAASTQEKMKATTRNFYFDSYFGESITPVVQAFGVALIMVSLIYSIVTFLG